ncbi:unnamed protein product, partial [Anisakis simplex]|uniref:GPI-anchored protein pfl2 n=1 Tax=Anisakis simplex TaxID=6269 RepID=A0A0M3JEJ1_ANISI
MMKSSSSSKSASPADSNEDRSASIASNQSNSTSSSTSNTSNHSVANKSPSESARSSVESNPTVIADRWSTSASLSKPNQTAPASVSKDMTNVPLTRNVIIERVSAKVPLLSGGAQRLTSPVNERRSVEKAAATRLQDVGERRRLSPDLVAQSAQSLSSSSSSASPSPAPAKSPSPASKSPSPEDSTTTES